VREVRAHCAEDVVRACKGGVRAGAVVGCRLAAHMAWSMTLRRLHLSAGPRAQHQDAFMARGQLPHIQRFTEHQGGMHEQHMHDVREGQV